MALERLKLLQERCAGMSRDQLLVIILALWESNREDESAQIENTKIIENMRKDYQELKTAYDELQAKYQDLDQALLHLSQVNQVQNNEIYGRGTEKMADILDAVPVQQQTDETDSTPKEQDSAQSGPNRAQRRASARHKGNGKRRSGWKKGDFSNLPQKNQFQLNIEELNRKYGEGNWRIVYWHKHPNLEEVPAYTYVNNVYTPVISVGLWRDMVTIPYDAPLWHRSYATPSIVSMIMYQKFALALPLYRQEKLFADLGVHLSRQTMCSWILRFSANYFGPVYEYLKVKLLEVPYHQCDETTVEVVNDGRSAGRLSYFWVHTTSELAGAPAIVLYCYELTRGADHLRKFYQDFQGFITCDAYCSYQTLEKEKVNAIILCGCMMHMRRRFVTSLLLIDQSNLDEEQIAALPEVKALDQIGKIYAADESLKDLPVEERQHRRENEVKPLVEDFYNYIGSLDTSNPLMGERLKDAIQYAMNQKDYLTRFLSDGHIPIDNGNVERRIRNYTLVRNNSLFCDSVSGAEATAVMCSVVQTARANGANIYWYMRYILEQMPTFPEGGDLGTMMPWSEDYQRYERQRTSHEPLPKDPNLYTERPKTPRKQKRKQLA